MNEAVNEGVRQKVIKKQIQNVGSAMKEAKGRGMDNNRNDFFFDTVIWGFSDLSKELWEDQKEKHFRQREH